MSIKFRLHLKLKVLKFFGLRWDTKKLTPFQVMISLFGVFGFCAAFTLSFFDPHEIDAFLDQHDLIVYIMYSVRVLVISGALAVLMTLSMFYQKTKRFRFYEAFDGYEILMRFYGKTFESNENKQIVIHLTIILYAISNVLLSEILFQYGLLASIKNILFSLANHIMYQNECFLNEMLFILRKYMEFTRELIEENRLSSKEKLGLKLKLRKLMELFNCSFGLLLFGNVFMTLFNLICNYYLMIGKSTTVSNFNYLWWIIINLDNLPLNIQRCLSFYESNNIKHQER